MPIITVQFIKEVVATPEQKRELIVRLTDTFVDVLGEVVRPFVYTLIQETPQNEWGIAGVPMPDLVYLTGQKHAQVIEKSNNHMRAAIAQMQATSNGNVETPNQHADGVWRGNGAQHMNGSNGTSSQSIVERNKAIIHRFYEAVNTKHREVFYELVHPDFVNHGGAVGDIVGSKALIDSLDPFYAAMPDWHVSEDYVVAQGDRVASRGTITGTHLGTFMGVPPTGKKVSWTGIIIYRLDADGKIIERWQDFDAFSMLQQLGVIPSPA
ncbi:MAG: ester cyclase [Anaerolineae bacterium]